MKYGSNAALESDRPGEENDHRGNRTISPSPDYAMIARAFDGYGEKVTQAENLRAALQRGLDAVSRGRLALIDVVLEAGNPGREQQAPVRPGRP